MNFKYEKVLVTGAAGFIGFQLSRRLLDDGIKVTGLDNLNPYYDVQLKKDRLGQISSHDNFTFANFDLVDRKALEDLFGNNDFDVVVNLAAECQDRRGRS